MAFCVITRNGLKLTSITEFGVRNDPDFGFNRSKLRARKWGNGFLVPLYSCDVHTFLYLYHFVVLCFVYCTFSVCLFLCFRFLVNE